MGFAFEQEFGDDPNPLDVVEQIVSANEWLYDRTAETELAVTFSGTWCDYHLHFSWNAMPGALQVVNAFDTRIPEARRTDLFTLLGLINPQVWLGHFDLMTEERFVMFRYVMLTDGAEEATPERCESLIEVAVEECERFYPAFQFVLWGGHSPEAALQAAMIETVGEA